MQPPSLTWLLGAKRRRWSASFVHLRGLLGHLALGFGVPSVNESFSPAAMAFS
jgi:hypothetical protein